MVFKIADNITSPLGLTTEDNYQAVLAGKSMLARHANQWNLPEPFVASLFSQDDEDAMQREGLTRFESMAVYSIKEALSHANIDIASAEVVLILSTTKGNVEELTDEADTLETSLPSAAAMKIAEAVGVKTLPIAVCNACISGVSAITLAKRLLNQGTYRHAIVCGADSQSRFIISGFQSLKAVSNYECRPFDIERLGLNLGEAAATIIFSSDNIKEQVGWSVDACAIRNDAFHVTNPSKKGEGCYKALSEITAGVELSSIAMVNAHGTATMYNDQMESVALDRMGLTNVPVNGLKGYYGHTMGAAGILETILCMRSLDDKTIPATRGYEERGVSGHVNVAKELQKAESHRFIKMISGFGGCNGALLLDKHETVVVEETPDVETFEEHRIELLPTSVCIDGQRLETETTGKAMLTELYKSQIGDYPKFYKMDMLCRLGFVATELLLQAEKKERFVECDDRAVVLFNRHSSICADQEFLASISDPEAYYPSPSVFIYTLPNIITGEIAIRNLYHGETSFYVLPTQDHQLMDNVVRTTFQDRKTTSVIAGWVDYKTEEDFCAELRLIVKKES